MTEEELFDAIDASVGNAVRTRIAAGTVSAMPAIIPPESARGRPDRRRGADDRVASLAAGSRDAGYLARWRGRVFAGPGTGDPDDLMREADAANRRGEREKAARLVGVACHNRRKLSARAAVLRLEDRAGG
jgi:hypothetical protein